MKIELPLPDGMALRITPGAYGSPNYPTDKIQKGLVLLSNIFGLLVLGHYLVSYDRIIWLIKGNHNLPA